MAMSHQQQVELLKQAVADGRVPAEQMEALRVMGLQL
jgi:hypothetical protein